MEVLGAPTALNELNRQIIKKLGMCWRRASDAEVFGRCDQSPTKVVLPDSVGPDAGRQRVRRIGEPVGETGPRGRPLFLLFCGAGPQDRRPAGIQFGPTATDVASDQEVWLRLLQSL